MAQAEEKHLNYEAWDDDTLYIDYYQDITGYTWTLTIKDEEETVLEKERTSHDAPADGETSFELSDTDTDGLGGNYDYWVRYEDASGSKTTSCKGRIYFAPSGE